MKIELSEDEIDTLIWFMSPMLRKDGNELAMKLVNIKSNAVELRSAIFDTFRKERNEN